MRPAPWIAPLTLFTLACQRPEVEAFRQAPAPVHVVFSVPEQVPDAARVAQEYGAALRARLATRVTVVPEGVTPPPGAATLTVNVVAMGPMAPGPSPAAVGLTTGVIAGTLSSLAGRGNHVFNGFWWGTLAANAAYRDRRDAEWLAGFRPTRVDAVFRLDVAGATRPAYEQDVNPRDVLDRIRPLRRSELEDSHRIREEEARAFAWTVVERLEKYFEWRPLARPSYYRAPGAAVPDPDEPLPRERPEAEAPVPAPPAEAAPSPSR